MKPITLTILMLLFVACSIDAKTYNITDGSKKQTVVIQKESGQGNVHAIKIIGEGNINGEATIALILNGEPYKTEKLSGHIEFRWGGDWYSDTAEIIYDPQSGTSGNITLKYKFETL